MSLKGLTWTANYKLLSEKKYSKYCISLLSLLIVKVVYENILFKTDSKP
jgi:hypothetical protein